MKGRSIQYFHDESSKVEPFCPVEMELERKEWHEKFFQLTEEEREAKKTCKTINGFVRQPSNQRSIDKPDDGVQRLF
jgi:hypothetical protein